MDNEDKYREIRKKLKALPRMNASDDFMVKLQHKINLLDSGEIQEETVKEHKPAAESKGFWLFKKTLPAWLIPAAGFGIVLVIVFSFWMIYKGSPDLPEQKISEQKTDGQTVPAPVEQSAPEIKSQTDISEKDLAVDMGREETAEEKTPTMPEPKSDELPLMKEPADKTPVDRIEDTKALPPLPSTREEKKMPESIINEKKIEAMEPEIKKDEGKAEIKETEKKNINAIKSEKGIDFNDKKDLLKEKTGVMEEKRKNKDGIRSKVDSVKKGDEK